MSDTQNDALPTVLPSLEEALREAEERLGGVVRVVEPEYHLLPETVRRLREARLKREIKEAERRALSAAKRLKRQRKPKKHYTQKRAVKRRSNEKYHRDHYRTSLEHRFSRWKRRSRTKAEGVGMTLEEFGVFWKRIDPKHQLPFYRVPERVTWTRRDTKQPWSLANLGDYATIGKGRKARRLLWKTLDLETKLVSKT